MMIENECPMATQSFISVFPSHPPLLRLLLFFPPRIFARYSSCFDALARFLAFDIYYGMAF